MVKVPLLYGQGSGEICLCADGVSLRFGMSRTGGGNWRAISTRADRGKRCKIPLDSFHLRCFCFDLVRNLEDPESKHSRIEIASLTSSSILNSSIIIFWESSIAAPLNRLSPIEFKRVSGMLFSETFGGVVPERIEFGSNELFEVLRVRYAMLNDREPRVLIYTGQPACSGNFGSARFCNFNRTLHFLNAFMGIHRAKSIAQRDGLNFKVKTVHVSVDHCEMIRASTASEMMEPVQPSDQLSRH